MCKVFMVITSITTLLLCISVVRRIILLPKQSTLFKIMSPQLLIWGCCQIFYTTVHGMSKSNFGIPPIFLSLTNLTSQILLGSTVLQLIVAWIVIYKKSSTLGDRNYQLHYWSTSCTVLMFSIILEIITSIFSYITWMRLILILWTMYLIVCCVYMLYYGMKIYKLTSHINNKNDVITSRAHRYIPIILGSLCGGIFTPVCIIFIFYASYISHIESSSWLPLFIWGMLWSGSCLYVGFLSVYFYITTTNQVKDASSGQSKTTSQIK